MRPVSAPGGTAPAAGTRRAAAARGGFGVPEPPAEAAPLPAGAAVAAVGVGLLALQADNSGGDAANGLAARHGVTLLAALTDLQQRMLAGSVPMPLLRQLAELGASVPAATDPALRAAVAQVVLRARVEIARHGTG